MLMSIIHPQTTTNYPKHPNTNHPNTTQPKTQTQSFGELAVRGNWIVSRYYKKEEDSSIMHVDGEGREWFLTGDVATIDGDGYMKITDRSKGAWMCGWYVDGWRRDGWASLLACIYT